MNLVYISMGGNLGNVEKTFEKAIEKIQQIGKIIQQSSLYKTSAWGMENAPDFLNQVLEIETSLTSEKLLLELKTFEIELGRNAKTQNEKYESRIIDLDILFFNDDILKNDILEIPHPKIAERNFILVPLNEISPLKIHPVLKLNINKILKNSKDKEVVSIKTH